MLVRGSVQFAIGKTLQQMEGEDEEKFLKTVSDTGSAFRMKIKDTRNKDGKDANTNMEWHVLGVGTCFGTRNLEMGDVSSGPNDQWRGSIVTREDSMLLTLTGEQIRNVFSKFGADFEPILRVLSQRVERTVRIVTSSDWETIRVVTDAESKDTVKSTGARMSTSSQNSRRRGTVRSIGSTATGQETSGRYLLNPGDRARLPQGNKRAVMGRQNRKRKVSGTIRF